MLCSISLHCSNRLSFSFSQNAVSLLSRHIISHQQLDELWQKDGLSRGAKVSLVGTPSTVEKKVGNILLLKEMRMSLISG